MTAEVAILNRRAVALAADSAVTITAGVRQKIFNSANKLLMLAEDHPVGVMVYGNADLVDVPWETLLKEFRRAHGTVEHAHLEGYARSLIDFLRAEGLALIDEDQRSRHAFSGVAGVLADLKDGIDNRIALHVERKHYFKPELNPRFLARYMQSDSRGSSDVD